MPFGLFEMCFNLLETAAIALIAGGVLFLLKMSVITRRSSMFFSLLERSIIAAEVSE